MDIIDFKEIGKRIKIKRIDLKLTQEKLAEMTDLTETYIGAIERATSKCSIETLVKIAQSLNMNLDYLVLGTNINNVNNRFSTLMQGMNKDKQKLYIELCESIADKLK